MALELTELEELLEGEGLKFFRAPDRPALLVAVRGLEDITYRVLMILELEGQFLQFRTLEFLHCESGHRHLANVLKLVGEINYKQRLFKLGWDPSDGEIVAYADVWVMDGTLTPMQFSRMVQLYFYSVDASFSRLKTILDTGQDPGERDITAIIEEQRKAGSLPKAIDDLLSRVRGKGGKPKKKSPKKVPTL